MKPLVVLVLQLLAVVQAGDSPFVDPIEAANVEYFDKDDKRYGVYLQKVTWDEANKLCPATRGKLLEYTTPDIAQFIAEALAESVVGSNALWIGGKYTPAVGANKGSWSWVSLLTEIKPPGDDIKVFPMEVSPFWVDKPDLAVPEPLCLATARRFHHYPIILGQPCDQKRSFICESPAKNSGEASQVGPPVVIEEKKFHLFIAEFTWAQALSQCRLLGYKLAVLTTPAEYRQISQRMLRSRPVMENAWIGGQYADGAWRWVTDGNQEIVAATGADAATTITLPWYRPENRINQGCLLADRHLCARFVFVEANCDRKRNLICEEVIKERETPLIKVQEDIWISVFPLPWLKSIQVCGECLDGTLLTLEDGAKVPQYKQLLYKAMALALKHTEVRHIWVGGYLVTEGFVWTNKIVNDSAGLEPVKFPEDTNPSDGFLEDCFTNYTAEIYLLKYKCLNLDREDQKHFFTYGIDCDIKQQFICKAKTADTKLAPNCLLTYGGSGSPNKATEIKSSQSASSNSTQ